MSTKYFFGRSLRIDGLALLLGVLLLATGVNYRGTAFAAEPAPVAEKPPAESAAPATGVNKKNALHVVDEQGQPVADFELKVWADNVQNSPWLFGSQGQIAQTQPAWGFDKSKAIDLTVRSDGYASTLQHFAGSDLDKLKADGAAIVMRRGTKVKINLRLPPDMTWPSGARPELYFDGLKNHVRSRWQPGSRRAAGGPPDFDMLNFAFEPLGTATLRLTSESAPFRVAIHLPGFLQFFERGPFTLDDIKGGKLDIDVDKPATLDVQFDTGASEVAKLPFESDLISVLWKMPEERFGYFMVAQSDGKPPQHTLKLDDLAVGEYRLYLRTTAKPGVEDLPDAVQDPINPGRFSIGKHIPLESGQIERVEIPYKPFDPKAFSGDRTVSLRILRANNSPAVGQTIAVTYFDDHYGVMQVFSGAVPDSGVVTVSGIIGRKPAGLLPEPYAVMHAKKMLGRFAVGVEPASPEFTFHLPASPEFTFRLSDGGQSGEQRNDPNFDAKVAHPVYVAEHPKVLFDEAHDNFHTAGGRYKAFADLITNDGYRVTPNAEKFTPALLAGYDILVIANATADGGRGGTDAEKSAFTEAECQAVADWVERGGSLLLITDHEPFGSASDLLAKRFGVDMSNRVTYDPANSAEDGLLFARDKGRIGDHPVTNGREPSERVNRVLTFTGQSLKGPPGSLAFLKFADTAIEDDDGKEVSAAGRAQGIALVHGQGRVVVTGEAAQLSAQVSGIPPTPFGMNTPGCDNRKMVLNIVHWLSGLTK